MKKLLIILLAAGTLHADEISDDLEYRVHELEVRLNGGPGYYREPKQSPENAEKCWQERQREMADKLGREIAERAYWGFYSIWAKR